MATNVEFCELIKSVKTEKLYVLTNKDFKVIKALSLLQGNRPINPKRVEEIKEAFKRGEFIPPILVALPSRQIAEGNHRYEAALKCLEEGIPFELLVYMYKDKEALSTARVINNTQKRWTANDRLNSYCFEGRASYVKLKNFMDEYPAQFKKNQTYSISSALCILAENRSNDSMHTAFYSGNLSIKDKHLEFAEIIMTELLLISEILKTQSVFARHHSTGWIKARTHLGISFAEFIKKLKQKAPKWQEPADNRTAWFNMYLGVASNL